MSGWTGPEIPESKVLLYHSVRSSIKYVDFIIIIFFYFFLTNMLYQSPIVYTKDK